MKKILLINVLLALVLGGLFVQPAFAATKYDFTVINYTNDEVVITLVKLNDDTPDEYDFVVDSFDENTEEFLKGEYYYEYEHCGEIIDGTFKLKEDTEWLIYPCGVEPTKMRFNSHFAEDITVTMYGPLEMPEPEEDDFVVELGGNRVDILSGHYIMSYEAFCSPVGTDPATVFSEEIRVLKNGTTQIMMRGCEWYSHPARTYGKPVPVKFKIINHASFPLILQIVGPEGALLDVKPGTNVYTLIYGSYKFGYFLDGQYHTGYMKVTKNGLGQLLLRPSHILELPLSESTEDGGE